MALLATVRKKATRAFPSELARAYAMQTSTQGTPRTSREARAKAAGPPPVPLLPPSSASPAAMAAAAPPSGGLGGLLGRLEGIGSDPLVAMGTGLLGASGYSTMPVSLGQAMAAGAQNMQRAGLLGMRQQMMAAQLEKMKHERAMAEAAAKQAAGQRSAQVEALVMAGVPRERAEMLATAGAAHPFLKPQTPPAFEQKLAALEQRLGRPLTEDEIVKIGGGGPAVSVSVGEMKPPTGYVFTDPANPAAGVVPLPGGPADPAAKAATQAGIDSAKLAQQQADARAALQAAEQDYERAIKQAAEDPSQIVRNNRRVSEAASAVALARQNLYNLGRELGPRMQETLTPPGILERAIEDTSSEVLGGLLQSTPTQQPVNPAPPGAVGEFPKPQGFSDDEYELLLRLRREQGE